MKKYFRYIVITLIIACLPVMGGCLACLPHFVPPKEGPVPSCYPTGKDPFIPMDHNCSMFNPWDFAASCMAPWVYGPPR
jgi:hypothetical protein